MRRGSWKIVSELIDTVSVCKKPYLVMTKEIPCEPVTRSIFGQMNPFRVGRRILSGMFEIGIVFLTKRNTHKNILRAVLVPEFVQLEHIKLVGYSSQP